MDIQNCSLYLKKKTILFVRFVCFGFYIEHIKLDRSPIVYTLSYTKEDAAFFLLYFIYSYERFKLIKVLLIQFNTHVLHSATPSTYDGHATINK